MIKLEHVSKSYTAGIPALNDVSLDIEEGEFVFIVGDSGSGKSTLIKLLLKELEPTEGTITINNKKLNKIKRRQIPKFRRNIGVVFQDFRLLKDRNIYDNEPKILLADEPTGNLDNHNAWEIMKLLEEINSRGTTVVVVTHNLEIVKAMNKRVITMKKGVVVEDSEGDYSDED